LKNITHIVIKNALHLIIAFFFVAVNYSFVTRRLVVCNHLYNSDILF